MKQTGYIIMMAILLVNCEAPKKCPVNIDPIGGKVDSVWIYEYNTIDRFGELNPIVGVGNEAFYKIETYSNSDQILSISDYNLSDKLIHKSIYKYSTKGILDRVDHYGLNGKIYLEETYSISGSDTLIRYQPFSHEYELSELRSTISNNIRLRTKIGRDGEKISVDTLLAYCDSIMVKFDTTTIKKEGTIDNITSNTSFFNEFGDIIKTHKIGALTFSFRSFDSTVNYDRTTLFMYEYDERNNWISKIPQSGRQPTIVKKRIKYKDGHISGSHFNEFDNLYLKAGSRDKALNDAANIAAIAQGFYLKPALLGGGGKSFNGMTFEDLKIDQLVVDDLNPNHAYSSDSQIEYVITFTSGFMVSGHAKPQMSDKKYFNFTIIPDDYFLEFINENITIKYDKDLFSNL